MIETRLVKVNAERPEPEIIQQAAAVLRAGGLVAFPTETVYGLGANALEPAAVRKIFTVKERPSHDPIIVHIVDLADLNRLAEQVPSVAYRLAEAFWPGPLTLVLRRTSLVPDEITAGGPTVAVRCPAHPIARALITAAGTPIGAPSANRFSRTSPTAAAHVLADLDGRIDLILDGGPTAVGVESTVVDVTGEVPRILRPGGVTAEQLRAVLGDIEIESGAALVPEGEKRPLPSPGTLERHYAPGTPLYLFEGEDAVVRQRLRRATAADGRRAVLLIAVEDQLYFEDCETVVVGSLADLAGVAQNLYAAMRTADQAGVDVILARSYPAEGLGAAIRDRLARAAEKTVNCL